MPSTRFLDSLNRQSDMTQRDLPIRLVSMTWSFVVGLVFCEAYLLTPPFLFYLLNEAVGMVAMKRLRPRFTKRWYTVLFVCCFFGSISTMAMAALVAMHQGAGAYIYTFVVFSGAILHVIVVRSYHMPFTIAIIFPMMLAGLAVTALYLQQEPDIVKVILGYSITIVLCIYTIKAIVEMHRTRQNLVEARDRSEQANRSKGRFVASMSHEIRTPLNGILGVAQLALEDAKTETDKDRAEVLYSSAITLKALVDDVLDHAKIEAGKMEIRPSPTDIRQLMNTVSRLFGELADNKGIAQRVDVEESVPPLVLADSLRVRQILSNLMSNAIKFTDIGTVTLRASVLATPAGQQLCIEVNDTGQGMTEIDQDRLFESFTQVDKNRERAAIGSGLGLAISRSLAQMMDGDLTVASVANRGTQFWFTMPLLLPDPNQAESTSNSAPAHHHENAVAALSLTAQRVLVVDDNRANRMIARAFLEKAQMHVSEADGGETALAMIQKTEFDLVLLDMHMPQMSGLETLDHLRALPLRCAGLPVIALTADAAPEDREFYLSSGMDGYLAKPLSKADLFHEIGRVLRQRAATELAAE